MCVCVCVCVCVYIQEFQVLTTECVCFLCIPEQMATFIGFLAEMESAYCAVRTESLNKRDQVSSLKV
jgi:hypothetical protein